MTEEPLQRRSCLWRRLWRTAVTVLLFIVCCQQMTCTKLVRVRMCVLQAFCGAMVLISTALTFVRCAHLMFHTDNASSSFMCHDLFVNRSGLLLQSTYVTSMSFLSCHALCCDFACCRYEDDLCFGVVYPCWRVENQ